LGMLKGIECNHKENGIETLQNNEIYNLAINNLALYDLAGTYQL
jgi:hypothetical protein